MQKSRANRRRVFDALGSVGRCGFTGVGGKFDIDDNAERGWEKIVHSAEAHATDGWRYAVSPGDDGDAMVEDG